MQNDLKIFEDVPFYMSLEELKNDLRVGDFVLVKLIPERNTFAKVVGITANGVILDSPAVAYYTDIISVCKVSRIKHDEQNG